MANFYCEYCGTKFPSVSNLTSMFCNRHPDGGNKGKHKLYEGSEKSQYTCKYCGNKFPAILNLTSMFCNRHPSGSNKGKNAPAI